MQTSDRTTSASAMRRVINMSLPLVSARVTTAIGGFVSMIMIAKLGHAQLAASALINSVSFAFLVPFGTLFYALSVLVGHAYGARQEASIGKIVHQGLWMGVIVGIPLMVLLWNIAPILIALGQKHKLALLTQEFFRAYSWGYIPLSWYTCISQFAAGISKQKLTLIFTMMSIPLTLIFGYIFIFGKWGFPALGISGMGYALALTYWLEDIIIVIYFYKAKEYAKYQLFSKDYKINLYYLKQLFHIGWPMVAMSAGELIALSMSTILVGWINEQQLAAQQITLQINLIVFMIPFSIATAATVLISQEMGRKNSHTIRSIGYSAMLLSAITTLIFLVIYLVMPKPLINLYLDAKITASQQIMAIAIPLLAITGVMNIFDAIRTVASFALRGMRDTLIPMIIFVVLGFVFSLPSSYILAFPFHYGVAGIRWGFVFGFCIGAIMLVYRFHKFSAPDIVAARY